MRDVVHRSPLEPTSTILPCCNRPMADFEPGGYLMTTVDRDVTCKPGDNLGLNDVVQALVDSITGPKKIQLLARLKEIRAEHGDTDFRQQADDLLRSAGMPGRFADGEIPHGEPGHQCIPPEALMQVQDSLNQVLEIIAGHQRALLEREYPEPMVFAMISNLHAVLLQKML